MATKNIFAARTTIRSIIAAVASLALAAHAIADTPRLISIPAGDLVQALETLAKQSDVNLVYQAAKLKGLHTNGVNATVTTQDAVKMLLEGTDLSLRTDAATGAMLITPVSESSSTDSTRGVPQAGAAVKLDEVVVTGSHLRGIAPESLPVIPISREELEKSGYKRLSDVLSSLPQNARQTSTAFLAGNYQANLRGLGSQYTLVLVNGRRANSGDPRIGADLNAIPVSAIERIEVLTDSAAAIYGSDAIGGVINVILRKDFRGFESSVTYGGDFQGDGYDQLTVSQLAGLGWDAGSVLLGYQYDKSSGLLTDYRKATATMPSEHIVGPYRQNALTASLNQKLSGVDFYAEGRLNARRNDFRYSGRYFYQASADERALTTGLRTPLVKGWDLDASLSYSYEKIRTDIFDRPTGASLAQTDIFNGELFEGSAVAQGPLFALPGGTSRLALGTQFKREQYEVTRASGVPNNLHRQWPSVFAEWSLPWVSAANAFTGVQLLEMNIAARYDRYEEFGDIFKPRVSARWRPVAGLQVRGGWGKSFKAPNVLDTYNTHSLPTVSLSLRDDPKAAGGTSIVALRGNDGLVQLGPEQATSWTLGLDFEPEFLPGAKLTATYAHLDFRDKVSAPSATLLQEAAYASLITRRPPSGADQTAFDAELAALYARASRIVYSRVPVNTPPSAVRAIIDVRLRNLAQVKNEAVDVLASYERELPLGKIEAGFNLAFLLEQSTQITPLAPADSTINVYLRPVDFKARGNLGWTAPGNGVSAMLFVNYVDGYRDNRPSSPGPIGSWTTFDASLRYSFEQRQAAWLSGLTLSANVINVLDEEPPFIVLGEEGFYDAANSDVRGRFISMNVSYKW